MEGTRQLFSQHKLFSWSVSRRHGLKEEFESAALPLLAHVYTAALYLTRDEHEANDLVQDTYLRAYRFFHKFEAGTNCKAWLLSIQRNLFINRYQQKRKQPEFVDWEKVNQNYESFALSDDAAERYNPENLFGSRDMAPEVERALKKLPEEFRSAVVLVDINELTYEEAARVMECAVGTVRSRLSRGRRILQVALRDLALQRGLLKE